MEAQVQGGRLKLLHYERIGERTKPIVLMVHGIGASSWMWWQQLDVLKQYQVILIDLPGHGKSVSTPWKSLKETSRLIVEEILKDQPAHIVGLSLGGHVALEIAKLFPKNTLSVFISGITVKPMPFKILIGLQSRLYQRMTHNESQIRKLAQENYQLPAEKFPIFKHNLQLLTRENYEQIGREIMNFSLDHSYNGITTPCLFLAGSEESKGILESIEIAPEIITGAEGKRILGAEHAWNVQQPNLFNDELNTWLETI